MQIHTVQRFQVSKQVLKQVTYAPQGSIYLIKNTVKYYYNLKYLYKITVNTILKYVPYDGKAEFSAAINIQCHMILQKSF